MKSRFKQHERNAMCTLETFFYSIFNLFFCADLIHVAGEGEINILSILVEFSMHFARQEDEHVDQPLVVKPPLLTYLGSNTSRDEP